MNSKADKKTILQRNFFWKFPLPPPLSRKKNRNLKVIFPRLALGVYRKTSSHCMCIESHFIIFSMDDFWLALIVTNQSQQSLALDVDVLEFASQIEILRKLIHFVLPSLFLSLPRTDSFFVLLVWHFIFFCWSVRLLLRYLSDGVHRIFSLFSTSLLLPSPHSRSTFFFYEWTRLVATFFVCFARANHHFKNNLFSFLENFSCFFFSSRSNSWRWLPKKHTHFSDPWNCL